MPKPEFARLLRVRLTEAEQRPWYLLRDRRFMGLKFRRQHQVDPFIADFVCIDARLVIEADGGQHSDASDAARDARFRRQGFHVLRFWNPEVLGQTEAVLEQIRQYVLDLGYVAEQDQP
ncbi:endonuclease domain-containing protein [Cupriavidus necator]|uniref:endonuclease domain-containing protein n=1 Tax=Cupriavidus necator TaxID=106590 RepID=UPI00277DD635|nr:endonuclease domain-containing protein [Cupriavidus necator]MDQ0140286.1 very-short-patch-repair endonuclease [Cupriavidus necator]